MPKSLVLGNGNILLCFDHRAQLRDFYFPYVGRENHAGGDSIHRIGVHTDGQFSWLDNAEWEISIKYQKETLVSEITATHKRLELEISFMDAVYNEKNIFLRKINVKNLAQRAREVRLFFNQEFHLSGTPLGDTAYYDPDRKVIVHYEGRRTFIIGGLRDGKSFDDYTVGLFDIEGKEGAWKDAEDGILSKNAIEHGSVDSVIGFHMPIDANGEAAMVYWIAVAETLDDARELHGYVLARTPEHLIETTKNFWRAWVNKRNFSFCGLDEAVIDLFKKSLLIIRTHVGSNGAIIASADSDMLKYGRDTYAYVWPRDAAFIAVALDKAGYSDVTKKFFEFANDIISEDGYFFHKYHSDKSLGSSWHPWIKDGVKQLAIQEDETALVLYALWEYYKESLDLEFVEAVYNSLIKRAAEFLYNYRDPATGLPQPSYDLWEEKYGVSPFTASTVYAGLVAASNFARLLGKTADEKRYLDAAHTLQKEIPEHLFNEKRGYFYRMIEYVGGKALHDETIDLSAFFGVLRFEVLNEGDERLKRSFATIEDWLCCKTPIGGAARYEGDNYYRAGEGTPGNPWFITTLWFVQYYIARAKKTEDLDIVKEWFAWVVKHATPSGILSEQVNPHTGFQLSAAPLIWSHAEFVLAVVQYLEKLEQFGVCKVYNPVE